MLTRNRAKTYGHIHCSSGNREHCLPNPNGRVQGSYKHFSSYTERSGQSRCFRRKRASRKENVLAEASKRKRRYSRKLANEPSCTRAKIPPITDNIFIDRGVESADEETVSNNKACVPLKGRDYISRSREELAKIVYWSRGKRKYQAPVVVAPSKIHGYGIFLAGNKTIPAGEFIIDMKGKLTSVQEQNHIIAKRGGQALYFVQWNGCEDYVMNCDIGGNESKYVNHSCSPNAELVTVTPQERLGVAKWERKHIYERDIVVCLALEDIWPGTEITVKYGMTAADDNPRRCRCSPGCTNWY